MRYPTELQACILFDRQLERFDDIVAVIRKTESEAGTDYNVVEHKPGTFLMMFGGNHMVSFAYLAHQADSAVFAQTLASPYTQVVCPDAPAIVARHRSHVLVSVRFGAMGGLEVQDMLAKMGMDVPGNSLGAFKGVIGHLEALATAFAIMPGAQLVHWGQSNQVYGPDKFIGVASGKIPDLLHIHPFLFGDGQDRQGRNLASITTFGARHFLGREIEVLASPVPWGDNIQNLLAFVRAALVPNGYVVPDGDTFADEAGSICYRVRHLPEEPGKVPLYQLEPLMHRDSGFVAPGYVPESRGFAPSQVPEGAMPSDARMRAALEEEWREKQAMARGIGGDLRVKVTGDAPVPQAPTNRLGRIFGRKR